MEDPTKDLLLNAQNLIKSLESKVQDLEGKLNSMHIAPTSEVKVREQTRLTKSSGKDIAESEGRIGGPFDITPNPPFLESRMSVFERLYEVQQAKLAQEPRTPIKITLPDGTVVEGKSFETSPLEIATNISEGLAKASIIAKVQYTNRLTRAVTLGGKQDGFEDSDSDGQFGELWDMARPLEGDCKLQLLKFDDKEARTVFWHSAAHLLGQCLECSLGSHLTVGPPVSTGFYYDSYIGDHGISDKTLSDLQTLGVKLAKQKQEFQRLVLTKEEALELFDYNPYKVSIINNKIKDGELTSVYRNGPFVDLCLGPHIVHTGAIKAVQLNQATTAFWLGQEGNDKLQRVHGIAFPEKKLLKEHKALMKKAAENDHRKRGLEQDLFFFHPLSPGSCFWSPHGAVIFTRLVEYMRKVNREAGYQEVVTPNIYSADLWKTSGHWEHYQKNMFTFTDGENPEHPDKHLYALKPMNCPGHCLIFDNKVRSYRDLPMRLSDFGVLHRNEASGALSGLTRVRRFQQDDAHIFCRHDQVETEVLNALRMVKKVYDTLGLSMKVSRSTRPKKACGLVKEDGSVDLNGVKLWDTAEEQLAKALDDFVGKGNWKDNPGDGAFYGPKIDVEVYDSLKRQHQCATIQLDFQLPLRFKLKYTGDRKGEGGSAVMQPVIIHRAVLGSLERMTAILTEHYGGKWPFWLSPRQVKLIPVAGALNDYANKLNEKLLSEGFSSEVDVSTKTLNKKILLAQKEQFNFMFVVGATEEANHSVNVRTRRNTKLGEMEFNEVLLQLHKYMNNKDLDEVVDPLADK